MADLVFAVRGTAEVIAEQEKIAQQQGKQKTLAKELSAEYAANEAELKKLGRTAQQIYSANETAQEKYNRKLAEAQAALQGNANAVELIAREEARLSKERDSALAKLNTLTTAATHRADVEARYALQLQREIQDMPILTSKTSDLMGKYTETGKSLDAIEQKQQTTFGPMAADRIVQFVGSVAGIQKVLSTVTAAMGEIDQKVTESADATLNNLGSLGQLQAVSNTPQEFQKNLGFARRLEQMGIVKPGQTGQAADITTALARAHISDSDREVLVSLAKDRTITAEQMEPLGVGVRAAQEIWGPSAGDFSKVTGQLMQASKIGKMDAAELATFIQKYGRQAVAAGVPLNEAITGGAIVTRTAATGKAAASRIDKYYQGFGDQDDALKKSDDKIKELGDKLQFDQSERAKSRAKRLAEHQTKEAERQKEFDEHEAERVSRVKEQMSDAATAMQRAQDDLEKQKSKGEITHQYELDDAKESLRRAQMEFGKHGDAAAGMRVKDAQTRISRILAADKNDPEGPQHRLDDSQLRIQRLTEELKPKHFKPGQLETMDDGSGIDNLQRELANERAKRAKVAADVDAARKKGYAKVALSPEEQKLFQENLPTISKGALPQSYITLDSRVNAADIHAKEEGSYAHEVSEDYETPKQLAGAARTALLRRASHLGYGQWLDETIMTGMNRWQPYNWQIQRGYPVMEPEDQSRVRQIMGWQQPVSGASDDRLVKLQEEQNRMLGGILRAAIEFGFHAQDGNVSAVPINSGD